MINPSMYKNILACFNKLASSSGEVHAALGSVAFWSIDTPVYVPKHFRPEELVPEYIFGIFGKSSYSLLDSRILWTADALREWFDRKITINDWLWKGEFDQRGFRTQVQTAKYSAHMFGRAIDFNVEGISAEEVQQRIRMGAGREPALRFVSRIESGTVGWTHVDCVNTGSDTLTIFKVV
jgi:hypothetical protein